MSSWYCHNTVDEMRNQYAKEAVDYIRELETKINGLQNTTFVIDKVNPNCKCTECKCKNKNA